MPFRYGADGCGITCLAGRSNASVAFAIPVGSGYPCSAISQCTLQAKLDARERVDGVVYAVMPRHEAAEHLRVGGVHYGIRGQRCYVAAPEPHVAAGRRLDVTHIRHAPVRQQGLKHFVLESKKLLGRGLGRACVHKRAEQVPLLLRVVAKWPRLLSAFLQKHFVQLGKSL